MSTTLLRNLDKGITGHVLNTCKSITQSQLNEGGSYLVITFVRFMHEFK